MRKRSKYRPHARAITADPLGLALRHAARLSEAEVQDTIGPARACLVRLRQGLASEDHHTVLSTCLQVAEGIEERGIVRGLAEYFAAARAALKAIRQRALADGAWRPTALYAIELATLREALELHEYQLRQVSAGELHQVAKKLIARTQSSGGAVLHTDMAQLEVFQ